MRFSTLLDESDLCVILCFNLVLILFLKVSSVNIIDVAASLTRNSVQRCKWEKLSNAS